MRKQFRIALLIMAYLWCWVGALAVPANPNAYVVTQPDGTRISVRLCGDEYYHYYTTEDGTPVTLCDDGFYRYTTIDAQNNLVASANVVGKVNASVLPDKKSVMQCHKELHKVNKMRKSVKLPEAQAPMRSAARNAGSNGGVVKGIIVLAEFQDQKFTFSQKAINDKMNKVEYTDEYGSIGSVHDYFVAQSYGQFQPEFDVVGPVTLSQNMAYYGANYQGANDIRPHEMVAEACQLASQQGLADMSDYDHDGDGWVDLVYVIYAGYPESSGAPSETIWPHAWYVYSGGGLLVTLDGVKLNAYACSAELNGNSGSNLEGIGTFCHEYSHTLGLPDFYDVDYSGAMGMSWWSIMAHGNYGANGYIPIGYNAYEREFCGWLEFNELTGDASITMPELNTDKTAAYKITSTNPNQYITIETRCRKGWDVALFSEGMMVIAVDYNKEVWDMNGPNDDPNRQRFKLIPADNNWSESDLYGDLYPYGGNTTLSSSSSPKMKVHNTTINGKSITGIAYNNGVTTFDFKMDDVSGDEQDSDLSYLEGTYNAFANSGFQNHPDELWQVNITVDDTDKNKVWIQPVCMFGGLDAEDISPIYATYNAADNTLIMPSGQVVYELSNSQFVIAQTTTGSDINLTDNFVMQIEKDDYSVEISFANDRFLGVGDVLNDEWWYQALYNISFSKTLAGDEVPAEIEGVYDAFANSALKDRPDENWQVNITIDEIVKGKVWIHPVCKFGGLDAEDISPIYATYNAANSILILPLGQVVFENSQYKMVIAQTVDGSDKNLTGNIVMQINNDGHGVDITFANDYILGVGNILNDEWWYQALYNVSYSKSTPEGDVATSITLDKSEVTLKAAQTTKLTATVLPETATNKSVAWTSSNEAVAIVVANGTVTAVGVGEAIITATTTDGSNLSASCVVTVLPTPGDANNDAIINVTDITTVASYILGLDTKLFVFDAADINNDDVVDVTDIVGIASVILNGGTASNVSSQRCAPSTSDAIKIEDFAAGKNQSQQVAIEMTNASDYSACQMDIRLPKGMSIAECELASAATDHMVAYRELPDGAVRVLVYSLTCRTLPDSEEGIIRLRTTTDNRFEGGEIVVENILFADRGQNEYRLYDSVANVNLATGVSATDVDCVVYAENRSIVIISPCDQQATITSVDGLSRIYTLNEGRNEIKDCKRGIYIIETLNRINKLIIK